MTLHLSYFPGGIEHQKAEREKKKVVTHVQKGFHELEDGVSGKGTVLKGERQKGRKRSLPCFGYKTTK